MAQYRRRTFLSGASTWSALQFGSRSSDPSPFDRSQSKRLPVPLSTAVATLQDFGGIGDGAFDNSYVWRQAVEWASQRALAGNTPKLIVPAGRYVSTSVPNLAINHFHIQFEGEVWLINTGRGSSLILDGGSEGDGVYGMVIKGWPQIYGTPESRHGVFARALFNSEFELNCRGAGSSSAGFCGEWLVDNSIRFVMSSNEGGLYSKPSVGMTLDTRNNSEDTSYNDIQVKISGVATGIRLDSALGNLFRSGSVQNCAVGIYASEKAWDNKLFAVDFESNDFDFLDKSRRLSFSECDLNSGGEFLRGSSGPRIFGGRSESIAIREGAQNVLLTGMAFNRTGEGELTDLGVATRMRDILNIAENRWVNDQG